LVLPEMHTVDLHILSYLLSLLSPQRATLIVSRSEPVRQACFAKKKLWAAGTTRNAQFLLGNGR